MLMAAGVLLASLAANHRGGRRLAAARLRLPAAPGVPSAGARPRWLPAVELVPTTAEASRPHPSAGADQHKPGRSRPPLAAEGARTRCDRGICAAPTSPSNRRAAPAPHRRRSRSWTPTTTPTPKPTWRSTTNIPAIELAECNRAATAASRRSTRTAKARKKARAGIPSPKAHAELQKTREETCETTNTASCVRGSRRSRGWAVEISTDIEVAHAICQQLPHPARGGQLGRLRRPRSRRGNTAVERLGATEVSNSWGGSEPLLDSAAFEHPGHRDHRRGRRRRLPQLDRSRGSGRTAKNISWAPTTPPPRPMWSPSAAPR